MEGARVTGANVEPAQRDQGSFRERGELVNPSAFVEEGTTRSAGRSNLRVHPSLRGNPLPE